MEHHVVRRHVLSVVVPVPLVDSMCPVFQLQSRMAIAGLPVRGVVWLRIVKPATFRD
jgi:hypothetical protein